MKDVEKRVVWVANRDNPVNDTSGVLSIGANGNLFLYAENQSDIPLWSAISNVSIASLSSSSAHEPNYKAQLLDTGNLVVKFQQQDGGEKLTVWQSFYYPKHTMLPSMKLGLDRLTRLNRFLTSWKSEDDPGTGSCSFRVDPNGAPQMVVYKDDVRWLRFGNLNGNRGWQNSATT
ncbi:G-type lectin S-receptor-like serine/threonine-protein kinase At4g27290 [Malus domestica]